MANPLFGMDKVVPQGVLYRTNLGYYKGYYKNAPPLQKFTQNFQKLSAFGMLYAW